MIIYLMPIVALIMGFVMYYNPPQKINNYSGYRTNRSMKNQESWDYSQKMCGFLSVILGFLMLIITIILHNVLEANYNFGFFQANFIVFGQIVFLLVGLCMPIELILYYRGKKK